MAIEAFAADRLVELDRDAGVEMAHDSRFAMADGHLGAERDHLSAIDGRAGDRAIDDDGGKAPAVLEGDDAVRVRKLEALVAAVLGKAKGLAIDEPSELGRQLVLLARRGDDRHGKAILELAHDHPFDAPDLLEVNDHARPDRTLDGSDEA